MNASLWGLHKKQSILLKPIVSPSQKQITLDKQIFGNMNKKHWNTVTLGGDVDDALLRELIDHSYELVYDKLTKKQKELLG